VSDHTRAVRRRIVTEAARLFTSAGYAATSTRAIASAVGLRQSSLYYYFPTKECILVRLLGSAWRPALEQAATIAAAPEPADVRLAALLLTDLEALLALPFELGALYYLPEARAPQFADLWRDRDRLRAHYVDLACEAAAAGRLPDGPGGAASAADLVFRITESLAVSRGDAGPPDAELVDVTVARCLALLGVADPAAVQAAAARLRHRLGVAPGAWDDAGA